MNLRDAILRVIGVVAFAAALLLAPSVASAHGSHAHHEHAVASASQDHAAHSHAAHSHAAQPKAFVARDIMSGSVAQEISAAPVSGDLPDCDGRDCCTAGHCAACVSAVLPPPAAAWPPSAGAVLLRDGAPAPASTTLEGLRRPPRLFV